MTVSRGDQGTNSLFHDTTLNGSQGVVDFDKIILAVLLQVHGIKLQLDVVVWVGSQLPLDVRVGGVRTVGEARGLDGPYVIGSQMFRKPEIL